MTSLQSINIAFTPHSTVTLLPNAVPDPDVAPPSSTTNLFPDAVPQLPAPISSHSTTAALLPDADAIPDAEPELPDATVTHPTAIAPLHNVTRFLLAKLTVNLQKMSSHHIVEAHRIENPEYIVKILGEETDIEFIGKVSTVAAEYIQFLHAPMIALDKWHSVGIEWRNLKKEIDRITSNSRSPNKARPLWKLSLKMHAYILSYLSNEDVLRVSFVARGSLSTMVHQDEDFWQQRAIYQLGGEQATTWYPKYSHELKPWKRICLTLTYKGIKSSETKRLGIFKNGKLNGLGRRQFIYIVSEGEFEEDNLIKGKITYDCGSTEEGTFKLVESSISGFFVEKLSGQGKKKFTYPRDYVLEEEGLFEEGLLHGKGKRIFYSIKNSMEVGSFDKGRFIEGMRTYTDGSTEEGTFEFEELIHGTKKFASGAVREEEGAFKNKKLHGQGKRVLKRFLNRKKVEVGKFVNGKLVHATSSNSAKSKSSSSSFFKGCFPLR